MKRVGIVAIGLAACSPQAEPDDAGAERVFATVASAPALEIGSMDGLVAFGKIADVAVLPSGEFAVADDFDLTVSVFSPIGDLRVRFGGEGQGPGEFTRYLSLQPYRGDSIAVGDLSTQRVSIFDRDGSFGRAVSLRFDDGFSIHDPIALEDGSFVVYAPAYGQRSGRATPGVDSTWIVRATPEGVERDTVARVPMLEFVSAPGRPLAVTRYGFARAAGHRIIWGWSRNSSLSEFTVDGIHVRNLARPWPVRSPTQDDRRRRADAEFEACRAAAPPGVCSPVSPEEVVLPDPIPVFTAATLLDSEGRLWVSVPIKPDLDVRDVFAVDGAYLGRVEMPAGLGVSAITGTSVVGTWRDSLGVEYVRVHRIARVAG